MQGRASLGCAERIGSTFDPFGFDFPLRGSEDLANQPSSRSMTEREGVILACADSRPGSPAVCRRGKGAAPRILLEQDASKPPKQGLLFVKTPANCKINPYLPFSRCGSVITLVHVPMHCSVCRNVGPTLASASEPPREPGPMPTARRAEASAFQGKPGCPRQALLGCGSAVLLRMEVVADGRYP